MSEETGYIKKVMRDFPSIHSDPIKHLFCFDEMQDGKKYAARFQCRRNGEHFMIDERVICEVEDVPSQTPLCDYVKRHGKRYGLDMKDF